MISDQDLEHLRLAVSLAHEALKAGDAPFGSVLVSSDNKVLQTDRNRTVTGSNGDGRADSTLHPEFTLARWAQLNLSDEERAKSTVYTSGLTVEGPVEELAKEVYQFQVESWTSKGFKSKSKA
ncbi:hypothetical protein CEK25_011258 [Fusarium fujikuroi]|nr:hypothetical protein CEK25_011258 [Fusarium fujikuroi]